MSNDIDITICIPGDKNQYSLKSVYKDYSDFVALEETRNHLNSELTLELRIKITRRLIKGKHSLNISLGLSNFYFTFG